MPDSQSNADPEPSGTRIEARALCRRFGEHMALNDLDLTIEPGESFGLLGANGAGKTTFIRLVTGYLIASSGAILVDGISPSHNPRAVQDRLGFVAETSRLYPELTVREYLRFAGGIRGLSGSALKEAIAESLDHFQLREVERRLIGNLSKGYQQRVSLAQAFLHKPSLLIIDEPTGGLDPVQRADVHAILASMHGRHTLVLCTHDLDEARSLTTRVAVLNRGRLVASGPTSEILERDNMLELFRDDSTSTAA
jgi:ABC-2 type transport system ATP-binding protein